MFEHSQLVEGAWPWAFEALCLSCGYFAYDQWDMLRYHLYSGWIPSILVHHLVLLLCFTLALYRNVTINYLILTLICEVYMTQLYQIFCPSGKKTISCVLSYSVWYFISLPKLCIQSVEGSFGLCSCIQFFCTWEKWGGWLVFGMWNAKLLRWNGFLIGEPSLWQGLHLTFLSQSSL